MGGIPTMGTRHVIPSISNLPFHTPPSYMIGNFILTRSDERLARVTEAFHASHSSSDENPSSGGINVLWGSIMIINQIAPIVITALRKEEDKIKSLPGLGSTSVRTAPYQFCYYVPHPHLDGRPICWQARIL